MSKKLEIPLKEKDESYPVYLIAEFHQDPAALDLINKNIQKIMNRGYAICFEWNKSDSLDDLRVIRERNKKMYHVWQYRLGVLPDEAYIFKTYLEKDYEKAREYMEPFTNFSIRSDISGDHVNDRAINTSPEFDKNKVELFNILEAAKNRNSSHELAGLSLKKCFNELLQHCTDLNKFIRPTPVDAEQSYINLIDSIKAHGVPTYNIDEDLNRNADYEMKIIHSGETNKELERQHIEIETRNVRMAQRIQEISKTAPVIAVVGASHLLNLQQALMNRNVLSSMLCVINSQAFHYKDTELTPYAVTLVDVGKGPKSEEIFKKVVFESTLSSDQPPSSAPKPAEFRRAQEESVKKVSAESIHM